MSTTPYDKCCCVACGPPWRDDGPRPDRETDFVGWLSWHSWMALCPLCGNKRCPGAADHENPCTGSNATGQPGSLFADIKPRIEVGPNGRIRERIPAPTMATEEQE